MTTNSNTLDELFTIYVDSIGEALPMTHQQFVNCPDAWSDQNVEAMYELTELYNSRESFSVLGAGYVDGSNLESVEG